MRRSLENSSSTSSNASQSEASKKSQLKAFKNDVNGVEDENAVAGYRSLSGSLQPNNFHGTASPSTQGRSVREFEEQLSALRKENFNLKLKLYFMEETLPGYQQAAMGGHEGPEALAKQIIDAKVEIEMLRKECKEKQDLLRDAAQAITHLEDLQKQTDEKYQTVVDELKQKINFMEMERELERSQSSTDMVNELNAQTDLAENINSMQKIGELESIIRNHEVQMEEYNSQITKLDEILVERDATIKECNVKIKTLEFQNAELIESLERKNKDLNNAEMELAEVRRKYNKLKLDYKEILNDYKAIKEEYKRRMCAMKHTERELEMQHEKIIEMESAVKAKRHLAENKIELLNEYDGLLRKFNSKRSGGGGGGGAGGGACGVAAGGSAGGAGGSSGCAAAGSSSSGNCYGSSEPRENRFFRTIMNKLEGKRLPTALGAGTSATNVQPPSAAAAASEAPATAAATPNNSLLAITGEPNCTKNKFQNLHVLPNVSLFKTAAPTASYANPYNYALDTYQKYDEYTDDMSSTLPIYECADQSQEYFCAAASIRKHQQRGAAVLMNESLAAATSGSNGHCSNCSAKFLDAPCNSKQPLQLRAALAAYENLLARKFWHNPKLAQNFLKLHGEKLCASIGDSAHAGSSAFATTTATAAAAAAAATATAAVAEAVDAYKNHLTVHATLRSTATMHVANEFELKVSCCGCHHNCESRATTAYTKKQNIEFYTRRPAANTSKARAHSVHRAYFKTHRFTGASTTTTAHRRIGKSFRTTRTTTSITAAKQKTVTSAISYATSASSIARTPATRCRPAFSMCKLWQLATKLTFFILEIFIMYFNIDFI